MHLLSIGATENLEQIKERILFEFKLLKEEEDVTVKSNEKKRGEFYFLNCSILDEELLRNSFSNTVSMFRYHVANVLSDIIISKWEKKLIDQIIKEHYYYFNEEEQKIIAKYSNRILNFDDVEGKNSYLYETNRKTQVLHKILEYLETNNQIIIEGFIKFRLKDYISELEDAVDRAVDEFLMEKEYKEFIKLLKYFVEIQEPKKDVIHVILNSKGFKLYDINMNQLNDDYLEDFTIEMAENSMNYDDLLVSALITIAPNKIIIHSSCPQNYKEALNTVKNIFDDRIMFCDGCEICKDKIDVKNHVDTQRL
ncbi:MAG: hypothetical protein PWQ82_1092 [Thermosediminibacterales bacterium]|nr:hypothetical protein [Thermosediminibacterales bacterium]MDK2835896.1 hypothetical protein [Thermosediminibacterales bacterium]